MTTNKHWKNLAWVAAVELALLQPAFAQEAIAEDGSYSSEDAAFEELFGEPEESSFESSKSEGSATAEAEAEYSASGEGSASETQSAEAAPAPPQKRRSGSRAFEEIVVTAQKREENLNDVPIAVQAFSGEALDARGINTTQDLMKATPSLDFGVQAGDFASVFLRGIGSEAWLTSDPSVASYVDGVYYSFTPSLIQDLGGVERVEVLKGPQGTLFGRNAIAGAINVITKEPDLIDRSITIDNFVGHYAGRHGQDAAVGINKTSIFANIPLTDDLAMNVSSFFEYDKQHWSTDSTIGADRDPVPAKKTFSARVKLRWLPTDNFELRTIVLGSKREGTATLAANIRPTPFGSEFQMVDGGDEQHRTVNPGLPIYGHLGSLVGIISPNYYHEWFDTKLIASWQVHSNPYNYDYDGAESEFASFIVHKHYAKIQEAEINFTSNDTSWGSEWLTWATGAFYFRNTQGFDPVDVSVFGFDPANLGGGVPPGAAPFVDALQAQQQVFADSLAANGGSDALIGAIGGAFDPNNLSNPGVPSYSLSNIGLL